MKRRFEYKGGFSNKFWEIEEATENNACGWVVRVRYGRMGSHGQMHYNVFWNKFEAANFHDKKINEKLDKGYKEVSQATPSYVKPVKQTLKKVCEHAQLRKVGDRKWKCNGCETHIEFDKPQTVVATVVEEIRQVRRFIDLSALRG
jgi:predicted DNA-binding WGR domain protein